MRYATATHHYKRPNGNKMNVVEVIEDLTPVMTPVPALEGVVAPEEPKLKLVETESEASQLTQTADWFEKFGFKTGDVIDTGFGLEKFGFKTGENEETEVESVDVDVETIEVAPPKKEKKKNDSRK